LQTKQAHEDARKRNSTTGELWYHNLKFYNNAPFHFIEALVKAYPEGILEPMYIRNKIRNDSWDEIIYPIKTTVNFAKEETINMVFKLFVETNPKYLESCAVSFIYAAFCICDTEVLKLMIQTNPNLLYQKDTCIGLPIHIACSMDMCKEIDLLLSFDPSQAQMVVEHIKMLPLHLACRPIDDDIIFDIEANPQATNEKDARGCLPLQYASGGVFYRTDRPDNNDFVSELLKIHPEATQILDTQ